MANTLPKLLLRRAEEFGDRVALRKKDFGIWQEIAWSDYARNVTSVAHGLLKYGVNRTDCVAIISENRPEWLYVDIGIQSIGGITAAITDSGTVIRDDFRLDDNLISGKTGPGSTTIDSNGNFFVTWSHTPDFINLYGRIRKFLPNGDPAGPSVDARSLSG